MEQKRRGCRTRALAAFRTKDPRPRTKLQQESAEMQTECPRQSASGSRADLTGASKADRRGSGSSPPNRNWMEGLRGKSRTQTTSPLAIGPLWERFSGWEAELVQCESDLASANTKCSRAQRRVVQDESSNNQHVALAMSTCIHILMPSSLTMHGGVLSVLRAKLADFNR